MVGFQSQTLTARLHVLEIPATTAVEEADFLIMPGPSPIPFTSGATQPATMPGTIGYMYPALLYLSSRL